MRSDDFKSRLIKSSALFLGIAMAVAILIFLIGSDISSRAASINRQRQELSVRSRSLDVVAALRAEANKSDKILNYLETILPTRDQLISFSKTLERFAKNNQLGFGFAFTSETAASEKEPGSNSFLVTSRGIYPNFFSFLKSIENSNYFVNFNYFDLNKKDKDFEILMKGKVFSQ